MRFFKRDKVSKAEREKRDQILDQIDELVIRHRLQDKLKTIPPSQDGRAIFLIG